MRTALTYFIVSSLMGAALLAGGCSGGKKAVQVPIMDAGAPDAGPPPEMALSLALPSEDGGTTLQELSRAGDPFILEPAQELHVVANRVLHNFRIRLFDEADHVLPSNDRSNDAVEGTHYDIA